MYKIQYLQAIGGQIISNEYIDTEFSFKDLKQAELKRIELQDSNSNRWYRILKIVDKIY
jgi:hypothetical protein